MPDTFFPILAFTLWDSFIEDLEKNGIIDSYISELEKASDSMSVTDKYFRLMYGNQLLKKIQSGSNSLQKFLFRILFTKIFSVRNNAAIIGKYKKSIDIPYWMFLFKLKERIASFKFVLKVYQKRASLKQAEEKGEESKRRKEKEQENEEP